MDVFQVNLTKQVEKTLHSLPKPVVLKLQAWIDGVSTFGLREMRKIPGFHDEPLKGKRLGQRSIRLNRAYRAIYVVDDSGVTHFIEIVEVNKHDY